MCKTKKCLTKTGRTKTGRTKTGRTKLVEQKLTFFSSCADLLVPVDGFEDGDGLALLRRHGWHDQLKSIYESV
jgi:hypothetical protein